MAWPWPFQTRDANTRTSWGYTYQWTPGHFSPEELHPLKYSYDKLADDCLDALDRISPPVSAELPRNRSSNAPNEKEKADDEEVAKPKRDLYALLKENASKDEKLGQLWDQVNSVPDWVDWEQIARGQDVFYRYGGVALNALTFQSLLGGMGANRVVETLARTGGFGPQVARHRLYETTQHILQVTRSLGSIQPGGAGHASSVRVRLLHAAVRRRILRLEGARPGYFDVGRLGVPINDLDAVGTVLSFSAALVWLGLPRQGIRLRRAEIADYLALWRLVAHYVGAPTGPLATPQRARAMMESILAAEIRPGEMSRRLANNVITCLQAQPPAFASRGFLLASARWLNGDELADALGLERPSAYYWALSAGQCIFFMCLCYTYRSIPYLDRRKIETLRKLFYSIIVTNKAHGLGVETSFDFKYVPDYNVVTDDAVYEKPEGQMSGVESRNLRALLLAMGAVGLASVIGIKLALMVGRGILRVFS